MSRVTAATDRARVIELLRYVASVLTSEGERNWIRRITEVLGVVEDASLDDLDALKKAGARYRTMFGRGGFGEFFVWRDAVDERMEANREYKAATDELWRLLSNAKGSNR
jgi:hypothetical protein